MREIPNIPQRALQLTVKNLTPLREARGPSSSQQSPPPGPTVIRHNGLSIRVTKLARGAICAMKLTYLYPLSVLNGPLQSVPHQSPCITQHGFRNVSKTRNNRSTHLDAVTRTFAVATPVTRTKENREAHNHNLVDTLLGGGRLSITSFVFEPRPK